MKRYIVTMTYDRLAWGILDRYMWDFCALPDDPKDPHPNMLPLEWRSRHSAEAWLQRCYKMWGAGLVPAPVDWRPPPPDAVDTVDSIRWP